MFAVEAVEALLQQAARDGHALTYSEALLALGERFTRPRMRALCAVLAEVDARARGRGEPELAVLVVRQSDGLPGQGWWVGLDGSGYDGPWVGERARAHIRSCQQRAFDHWARRRKLRTVRKTIASASQQR